MKNKYKILVFLTLILLMPSIIYASSTIQTYIVEDIDIRCPWSLNNQLDYPLLSYNDNTYMSVRDVAKLKNKDIIWQEDDRKIVFVKKYENDYIIKDEKTAMAIGKGLVEGYFGAQISENTLYDVRESAYDDNYSDNTWLVSAKFNSEKKEYENDEILLNPDARVEISAVTGDFKIIEFDRNGISNVIVNYRCF